MTKREGFKLDKNTIKPLSALSPKKRGIVARLDLKGAMRRRIQDLGLIDNTVVEALQRSPSGDPVAYFIRGAVIALRSETASSIMVRELG